MLPLIGDLVTTFAVTPQGIFYRGYEKFRSTLMHSDGIPAIRFEKDLYGCYHDGSGARALFFHEDMEFTSKFTVRGNFFYGFVNVYQTGDRSRRVLLKIDLATGVFQEISMSESS